MLGFTVISQGIVDDASVPGLKCRIWPHGDMRPTAMRPGKISR